MQSLDLFLSEKLKQNIDANLEKFSGKTFLHTSPHHDDILLGYFPIIQQLNLQNQTKNYFAIMTNGSNSVTDEYLQNCLSNLQKNIVNIKNLSLDKNNEIRLFIEALASEDLDQRSFAKAIRCARDITQVYGIDFTQEAVNSVIIQINMFLSEKNIDSKIISLKSLIRCWEEEVAWFSQGFEISNINFMNLGFYSDKQGNIEFDRDIKPVVEFIRKIKPDVLTVAMESGGIGHPTHEKVFNIVMQAVNFYLQESPNKKLDVWGYRNVWCRFLPEEASLIFPVILNEFVLLKNIFNISYGSQIKAVTPSREYDGPFCDFMQKIMHEQYQKIKTCIGQEYFDKHPNKRIKTAQGFCLVKFIENFHRNKK